MHCIREESWLAPADMRTDGGVSHADQQGLLHHRHQSYLHQADQGLHQGLHHPPHNDKGPLVIKVLVLTLALKTQSRGLLVISIVR